MAFGIACLTGCAAAPPRLHAPDRIDASCGDRVAQTTAVESIIASTDDAVENVAIPAPGAIVRMVRTGGGVIAHWNDQPLYLPAVAKVVGISGDYVRLGDAAIGAPPTGASRRIYLTIKTPAGGKTLALRAYDVQDVCNEGKLKS